MADRLDRAGLAHLWSRIKSRFVADETRIAALEEGLADLRSRYQGIEYLDSQLRPNNTQYINTGVFPTGNTRVVLDAQLRNSDVGYRILGEQKTTGKKFRFGTFQGTQYLIRYAGLTDYTVAFGTYNPTERHTFEVGRYFKIDGNQLKDFGAQTFTGDIPIYLYAINDTSLIDNAPLRLYSCQIYEGDELIRDFRPCYHRIFLDIGLYDLVKNKLYTNNGSGSFLAGPETEERW